MFDMPSNTHTQIEKRQQEHLCFLACGVNDVSKEKLTSREINILRTVCLKFFNSISSFDHTADNFYFKNCITYVRIM